MRTDVHMGVVPVSGLSATRDPTRTWRQLFHATLMWCAPHAWNQTLCLICLLSVSPSQGASWSACPSQVASWSASLSWAASSSVSLSWAASHMSETMGYTKPHQPHYPLTRQVYTADLWRHSCTLATHWPHSFISLAWETHITLTCSCPIQDTLVGSPGPVDLNLHLVSENFLFAFLPDGASVLLGHRLRFAIILAFRPCRKSDKWTNWPWWYIIVSHSVTDFHKVTLTVLLRKNNRDYGRPHSLLEILAQTFQTLGKLRQNFICMSGPQVALMMRLTYAAGRQCRVSGLSPPQGILDQFLHVQTRLHRHNLVHHPLVSCECRWTLCGIDFDICREPDLERDLDFEWEWPRHLLVTVTSREKCLSGHDSWGSTSRALLLKLTSDCGRQKFMVTWILAAIVFLPPGACWCLLNFLYPVDWTRDNDYCWLDV